MTFPALKGDISDVTAVDELLDATESHVPTRADEAHRIEMIRYRNVKLSPEDFMFPLFNLSCVRLGVIQLRGDRSNR